MHEDVFRATEDIGKAEALALVEPLHPRRLQGQGKNIGADHLGRVFAKRQDHAFRRVYAQDFNSLNAALRALDADFDARAICDRPLTEVPQNIRVQENICIRLV